MTKLIEFKDKLTAFYAKAGVYLKHVINFVFAFVALFIIGREIGYNNILANPLICLAVALICAFLPINVTVVISTIFILLHLFSLSVELAVIATLVILVVYLLFFRFAPKTGYLLILAPILFFLKVPYLLPVIAALTVGLTGIIPVICGSFIFYLMDFASQYSKAITTLDSSSTISNMTFIFNSIINNTEMIILIVSFAVVILIIYLIKRLSVDYSWIIAIIAGCVTDALIQIIAFSVMSVNYNIALLLIGHIAAILIGLILNLFIFSVDYSTTEFVQFEDNDYYYYVKAVPKMTVATRDVTVKKINSRLDNKGFVHTEGFEEKEEDFEE